MLIRTWFSCSGAAVKNLVASLEPFKGLFESMPFCGKVEMLLCSKLEFGFSKCNRMDVNHTTMYSRCENLKSIGLRLLGQSDI